MAVPIPLLQPQILAATVQKFIAPQPMIMTNLAPKTPWAFPDVTWDILTGSKKVGTFNVPNAEAKIVDRLGRGQGTAHMAYYREKKTFQPTTLHWLRAPGQIAQTNAEAMVLREINDLNIRCDNLVELGFWKMLFGTWVIDDPAIQATVDYKMPSTHKPFVGTSWATATPPQIISDINAWKTLISRDAGVEATDVYISRPTMTYVFNSFVNATYGILLSDTQKNQFYTTGVIPGFQGLNWHIQESYYQLDDGTITKFLPDNGIVMGNFTENRPFELYEGPSADEDAMSLSPGDVYIGKFAKTWKEPDPSSLQYLLEYQFLPVMTRPENFVSVANVTATS